MQKGHKAANKEQRKLNTMYIREDNLYTLKGNH